MSYYSPVKYIDDPVTLAAIQELLAGNLSLAWLQVGERVRVRPKDPERGLTYEDCNVGGYGYDALPESVVNHPSMIPRGCTEENGFPDLGYTVNRKSDIWADNAPQLFEEAKARSWNPATGIDWRAIQAADIPPEIENAFCQLCTFFAEAGFFGDQIVAADLDLTRASGSTARRTAREDTILGEWFRQGSEFVVRVPAD